MAILQHGARRSALRTLPSKFAKRRQHLIDEDLNAGYQIPAILTGIILFGLLSMILSVFAIILTGSQ